MSHAGPPPEGQDSTDLEQIQGDIEHTRAELAATVDELTAKLDVGVQARNLADRARAAVLTEDGQPQPWALIAAAGVAGAVLLLVSRSVRR